MARPRPHLPVRPVWLCGRCGAPWPCGAARLSLLSEYRGDRTSLLVYLAVLREEAREHLTALHPATPPGDLTDRFLTWARARR
ncbi:MULTISPECIES: flavin reductase [unclassified Micromonospora]|uniref:flavin reductase n=1 Tax=Micromonospora TaxID=1873 RepID=UPI002417B454|nr:MULTISPECIES: flavin reductase [unclassified Micromonospora]MDG4818568.1 flavin reductase [Micromonospora sp. WMMD956]WFE61100.1 flavin reductase [Micromonospora sp. WMMD712]